MPRQINSFTLKTFTQHKLSKHHQLYEFSHLGFHGLFSNLATNHNFNIILVKFHLRRAWGIFPTYSTSIKWRISHLQEFHTLNVYPPVFTFIPPRFNIYPSMIIKYPLVFNISHLVHRPQDIKLTKSRVQWCISQQWVQSNIILLYMSNICVCVSV